MAEADYLRWHWNEDGDRQCDDCMFEVYVIDDGLICSVCGRQCEAIDNAPAYPDPRLPRRALWPERTQ